LYMPELPLLLGSYSLIIRLYGPAIDDFYDQVVPGRPFSITGPPTKGFGLGLNHLIKFKHSWEKL
jgi:hypothetical protein